jgi:16S rRNA processing protein RimM
MKRASPSRSTSSTDVVPILVGYVRRAHGINGAVVVRPLTDDPTGRWLSGAEMASDDNPSITYTIAEVGPHKDGLLVRFEGVFDREAAEALRGTSFTIAADERRDLDSEEFWPDDLVGCTVVDETGESLGTVESVVFGAAQDRLSVRTPEGRVEVPFVDAIVPIVDLDARRIVMTPPIGLFPSNEEPG